MIPPRTDARQSDKEVHQCRSAPRWGRPAILCTRTSAFCKPLKRTRHRSSARTDADAVQGGGERCARGAAQSLRRLNGEPGATRRVKPAASARSQPPESPKVIRLKEALVPAEGCFFESLLLSPHDRHPPQPSKVLQPAEDRLVESSLALAHLEGPATRPPLAGPLTQGLLGPHGVQAHEDQGLEQPLGRDARAPPPGYSRPRACGTSPRAPRRPSTRWPAEGAFRGPRARGGS